MWWKPKYKLSILIIINNVLKCRFSCSTWHFDIWISYTLPLITYSRDHFWLHCHIYEWLDNPIKIWNLNYNSKVNKSLVNTFFSIQLTILCVANALIKSKGMNKSHLKIFQRHLTIVYFQIKSSSNVSLLTMIFKAIIFLMISMVKDLTEQANLGQF